MSEALELAILLSLKDQASSGLKSITDKLGPLGVGIVAAGGAAVAMGKALWDMGTLAAEEEQGITRLATAVKNSGADWNSASLEIENYLSSELKRVALDDGDGRASITRLTTATGNYRDAMAAMPYVIDLAAGANIGLEQATQLVARGLDGNVAGLSKLIPGLEKGASATEIFAAINSSFGGSAEASADTFVGAQKKMDIALGNIKETIGAAVLPAMTDLMTGLGDLAMRALPQVEAFIKDPFVPTLQMAKEWLGPKIQEVITWIKDVGVPWAVTAFGDVQKFLEDPVTPTLRTIWNWLGPKIQDVIGWIKDTGVPWAVTAFGDVQKFLEDPVLPILKDIGEWLGPKVQGAITWVKETGGPWAIAAFKSIQEFLNDPVMPIVRSLIDFLGPKLVGVVTWFKDTGAPWLKGAFDVVIGPVKTLVDWISNAIDKLRELTAMPVPGGGGGGAGGVGAGPAGAVWGVGAAVGVTALNTPMGGLGYVTGGGGGGLSVSGGGLGPGVGVWNADFPPWNPTGGLSIGTSDQWDWTTPIGPGGESPVKPRGAKMGVPWQEAWGPWPFGDWSNYEFNTQGYQQKFGQGPAGKTWYIRYAGWYRHGEKQPNYWGAGGGTTPTIPAGPTYSTIVPPVQPETPGGLQEEIIPEIPGLNDTNLPGIWGPQPGITTPPPHPWPSMAGAGGNTYVLNYSAYRQEPGYNDAVDMLKRLELYARLHG